MIVNDELWAMIEPLLPRVERRARHPGRKRRLVFQGILFVLRTGIPREHLPQELGFGSDMTCRRPWRSGPKPASSRGCTRLSSHVSAERTL